MTIFIFANSLDPDQARHFVGPDLDPNCLHSGGIPEKRRFLKRLILKKNQQRTNSQERKRKSRYQWTIANVKPRSHCPGLTCRFTPV